MAIVYGTNSSETINALDGVTENADSIYGYGGNDTIFGLGGNDFITGGAGADTISGGSGIDTAFYTDSGTGVTVSLTSGKGKGGTAEGDTLTSIENLYGSAHDDALTGNSAANSLSGMDGADILKGGGGDDVLSGGAGEDWLVGGAGADKMYGGDINDLNDYDTVSYAGSSEGVTVSLLLNEGFGGDAEGDLLYSIEIVRGSSHNDLLIGNDGVNYFEGEGGNDTIKGFGGTDEISGGEGDDAIYGMDGNDYIGGGDDNDTIVGGADNDSLSGNDGLDVLIGGTGVDKLTGGADADLFVWDATAETGVTQATADKVTDFSFADGDRLDFQDIDADVYAAGNQAFVFIGTNAFSGTPGEINYYHADGNTFVQMQTGTSVDIEGMIQLSGIHTPEANWFVL